MRDTLAASPSPLSSVKFAAGEPPRATYHEWGEKPGEMRIRAATNSEARKQKEASALVQSTMSAAATTDRDRPVAWSVAVAGSRSQGAGESTEEFENMRQSVSLSFAQLRLNRSIARSPRNSQPHNTLALHSFLARPPPPPRPRMPSADLAPPLRGFTRY